MACAESEAAAPVVALAFWIGRATTVCQAPAPRRRAWIRARHPMVWVPERAKTTGGLTTIRRSAISSVSPLPVVA